MGKKQKDKGGDILFESYYRQIFEDRWPALKEALLVDRKPIAYKDGLEAEYYLDEASVIAAKLLDVQSKDSVLDMCAAPGGKTLVLASLLKGTGSLTANDRSSARRSRLRNVIDSHVPEVWKASISVTGHDASKWGLYEQEMYDRILLDAPCSSERHVLCDPAALKQWTPSRPKHLAIQQFAMLAAALEAVKIGGYILYSTCALIPLEDELVIEKLFSKREGRFELVPIEAPFSEKRTYGSIILPDTSGGKGPLYFCLIRRIA
ncbi:tRNA/rRNA cytosine-C5-methylase [Sphaerochaeta pleomorpha str. Grapes]|uniref:NOL1/NOP2/Sun domain family member 4 n=1 Tax=Sphaerochaeta pleomorpha (strain ATCC BAA-1885 / DSM 22778 / Grapes) TaxID=158190 RepID=G8QY26_SPHPG|nr:RNA methyltransferase [Sphaerochaeta pleomorpha]AEV28531.1 tRNA/rRNA cytosine-C5-methylase [Sphaerochaeta pleomorpha str. Grapes]